MTSDEGSQLFVNGQLVVDNDGLHEQREASGSIALQKGTHSFRVTYFERNGAEMLDVKYSPPLSTFKVGLSGALLSRDGPFSEHDLVLEHGVIHGVDDTWRTVPLQNMYTSPVVICTPNYTTSQVPVVIRVRNAVGNQFEVRGPESW